MTLLKVAWLNLLTERDAGARGMQGQGGKRVNGDRTR